MGMQAIPFVLGGQAHRLPGAGFFPVTERLGFVVVDFHRPIPWHGNLFGHQPQPPCASLPNPECGMCRMHIVFPGLPFFFPTGILGITRRLEKLQKFAIADQKTAAWNAGTSRDMDAEFVVPAIIWTNLVLAQPHLARRNRQPAHWPGPARCRGKVANPGWGLTYFSPCWRMNTMKSPGGSAHARCPWGSPTRDCANPIGSAKAFADDPSTTSRILSRYAPPAPQTASHNWTRPNRPNSSRPRPRRT